jgi:hypothetical protein
MNGSETISVKGRLRRNIKFWEANLQPSQFILNTIRFGYRLPFDSCLPPSIFLSNNRSALNESEFVQNSICELLALGSIIECSNIPFVVNPLSVSVQPNGKKRLILDLRHVNCFLQKHHFKFEDSYSMFRMLSNGFSPKFWACIFDIKSGYHHIDIFPDHQIYLGFSWLCNGTVRYFQFTVLPFGLSSGPYIFTKMLRPLISFWRSRAINIVVYLDDGMAVFSSREEGIHNSRIIKSCLLGAGFVPNKSKSIWDPVQCVKWLGFKWSSKQGCVSVPIDKIDKLFSIISSVINARHVTARQLASVTGKIISNMLVFGKNTTIMTKQLHAVIDARSSWDSRVILTLDALAEL